MFYHGKRTYPGRWFVQLIEAALVVGIIFFSIDALLNVVLPRDGIVIETTWVEPVEIQIQPHSFEYAAPLTGYDYFGLALDHQTSGQYYEAILDYTRVIEMDPYFSSALLNRGVAYEQMGNEYLAMQDLNRFLNRSEALRIKSSDLVNGGSVRVDVAEGYVYEFAFEARAGQVISASVISVEADVLDPLLVLVDDGGQPVTASDDMLRQDGSLIAMDSYVDSYTILSSGTYTLRVSHAGGGSYGLAEVRLDLRNN